MSFASMLKGLVDERINFIVVGGVAAAAHGATRITSDLDIVYQADDPANLHRLGQLLASWNAYPRGIDPGLPFIMDGRTLHSAPLLTLTSSEGDIDVLATISGVGGYSAISEHSEGVEAFGVKFRIIDLPTLIKAKRAAGRPRDFEHLPELEALLALKRRNRKRT